MQKYVLEMDESEKLSLETLMNDSIVYIYTKDDVIEGLINDQISDGGLDLENKIVESVVFQCIPIGTYYKIYINYIPVKFKGKWLRIEKEKRIKNREINNILQKFKFIINYGSDTEIKVDEIEVEENIDIILNPQA